MTVFYLRNCRAPDNKVVPVTVSLDTEVLYPVIGSGFPTLRDMEGDEVFVLTLSTPELDVNGDPIPTETVNIVSEATVHLEFEAALGRIGQKINWGTLADDERPPRVVDLRPGLNQTTGVPILSSILVRLQEALPAAGIDLSTLTMRLNDFVVISGGITQPGFDVHFKGNPFDLTIVHDPKKLL